ncbi:MAG: hypothetical protein A2284_03410 [Deltaproteobacteria bacterium RIFOXYA12_FULL_61_11]|nr:MAG: hypothetical protein A2284_03410 [Deltaproteobacteria bacterium RIFOXYA12_FULL_61_11]
MSSNVVQLFLFFLYAVGANTLLHLPMEPAVLTAAKHHSDVLVVLLSASAAALGEYLNLLFLRRLYLSRVLEAVVVKNVLFQKSLRWFQIAPFSVTVIFAFTPLPFDVIRLLAPASSFPLASYLAAVVCGRTPRYVLFAWFGEAWQPPWWVTAGFVAVMLLVVTMPFFLAVRRARRELREEEPSKEVE